MLSEKKLLIRSFDLQYTKGNDVAITPTNRHIFYVITYDDLNNDQDLTDKDPKYLFVSDKQGDNLRQVSPADYDLQNWQLVKSANKVFGTARKDSDKNNLFNEKVELITFEVDMDKGTAAREVFSTAFKNNLKLLYEKDWNESKK